MPELPATRRFRQFGLKSFLILVAVSGPALAWCVGFFRSEPQVLCPVTGRVVFSDGSSLPGMYVWFQPHASSAHTYVGTAITSADGAYALGTFERNDGALRGEYTVAVGLHDTNGEEKISDQFSDPAKSKLKHVVRPGKNRYDIYLPFPPPQDP
jgi:hypothetical protein